MISADNTNELRILIIDDNLEIHKDFIKILTNSSDKTKYIDEVSATLFGDEEQKNPHPRPMLPAFRIDTATQGKEGYEKIISSIKENHPYALAFVDVRMPPGWDGIETIKHIWEVDPNIQVVICTAYSDYSWEETVQQLGEKENLLILKKPFDYVSVRQLSLALTKKWELLRKTQSHTKELENKVEARTKSLQEFLSISRGTLESSMDGILVLNNKDEIIDYNNKLIEIWQLSKEFLEKKDGNALLNIIADNMQDKNNFLNIIHGLKAKPETITLKIIKCNDGRVIEHYTQPYKLNGEIAGRIWSFRDITARTLLEEKIHFQATHDVLTGLPNRQFIIEFISHQILKSKRNKTKFAVVFFDLDRFKLINDSFGHNVGDDLLKQVALRLKKNTRESDLIGRLGGDEFLFIITDFTSTDALKNNTDKILEIFKNPFNVSNRKLVITPSIGVSVYPDNGASVDELISTADTTMYHAKEMGGAQIKYFDDKLQKENLEKAEKENELRQAIRNNELFLSYQPQLDLQTNKLVSVEALIRWRHKTKGVIAPIDFMPLVEELGLNAVITTWVLKTACEQNVAWQRMGLAKIKVAVNVATEEFKQANFVSLVKSVLEESGLKPEYLEIELTENIIVNDPDARNKIMQLKELGVSIAIDDFGAGYSSLNYLRNIPIDRLKIDKSFIDNIDIERGDEAIIQAIITMAKNLNLDILAEGVETKKQLDFLLAKNCNRIQGYYYSKPISTLEIEKLLRGKGTKGSSEPEKS